MFPNIGYFVTHTMSTKTTYTEKDVISQFNEDGYEAFASKRGGSDKLKEYLVTHKMKSSTGTNAEKWARIVRDCVPGEQHLADPSHYHSIPNKFMRRLDFWKHHHILGAKVVSSQPFQFVLTALALHQLHYWSYMAYVYPLKFFPFYNTMSCQAAQHVTGCGIIHELQKYSFKSGGDLKQYMVFVATQYCVKWATKVMSPYKRA